ncbi:hypothetical protein [Thermoanaerobacterium thermosaccharolyticum]|uniref:hypothetical protein n=1 Tax=Thermoanaerobacterium thermosaccharolyticum TaxID=1517 RepID=UPI0013E8EEF4|nr:hypothetical protein [Thermoanaerobacterium thermosaccharolyticum]
MNNFPTKVEGIDKEIKLQDLISDEIFNKYINYLEKNQLNQVVGLYKEVYNELKSILNKHNNEFFDLEAASKILNQN